MNQLRQMLQRLDGKGYKAYKELTGTYRENELLLHMDHIQSDPFAAPSRIRIEVRGMVIEPEWLATPWRRTAIEDFFARYAAEMIRSNQARNGGSGKSGAIMVDAPGQAVLARTAARVSPDTLELRLSVGLPAAGRTVLGRAAAKLLCEQIPAIARQTAQGFDRRKLLAHLELADQQAAIRAFLKERGFAAFVANGAILPRESGVSSRPMRGREVIPFQSPASLEVEITLPHRGPIRGMAIPKGVTLIVGGGYHGKSTLLQAIERGVYNHVAGDGREYVITDDSACKIRAEDGRRVEKVDISAFITNLPFDKDTQRFSTEDASGSTSQAANIMEMLELGTELLLIDEDTSATNFMIRDARMQALVAKSKEPITPFVDKVRQLYEEHHVSTILVLGGSGDYFAVADTVIMMDEYRPANVTAEAHRIAREIEHGRRPEGGRAFGRLTSRSVRSDSFDASRGSREKVDAKGLAKIVYGTHDIDLTYVEQLIDPSQTRAISNMLVVLANRLADGKTPVAEMVDKLYALVAEKGLDAVSPFYGKHPGDLALPRKFELAAALNRLRTLRVQ
ncbi:ABC-ATPase domain-containing protein [Paenibacillus turpanensis]|uniref:ABC-ATPase domain-containing protein n=1 Tax=Paenibacillus turpanensis TaxID=2689078 RepID=UPI00140C6F18|nr:ABC-ATPase domain-containing protein [Paenibacillus turpanensis]